MAAPPPTNPPSPSTEDENRPSQSLSHPPFFGPQPSPNHPYGLQSAPAVPTAAPSATSNTYHKTTFKLTASDGTVIRQISHHFSGQEEERAAILRLRDNTPPGAEWDVEFVAAEGQTLDMAAIRNARPPPLPIQPSPAPQPAPLHSITASTSQPLTAPASTSQSTYPRTKFKIVHPSGDCDEMHFHFSNAEEAKKRLDGIAEEWRGKSRGVRFMVEYSGADGGLLDVRNGPRLAAWGGVQEELRGRAACSDGEEYSDGYSSSGSQCCTYGVRWGASQPGRGG